MEENRAVRVLVTGFEPFNGEKTNPSFDALKLVKEPENTKLHILELPVSFEKAPEILIRSIEKLNPDAVICVGQAAGRSAITPEKVGINWRQASIPDNDGKMPLGERIAENSPDAYFSTLPIEEITKQIQKAKIPARISWSAGTYVCNTLMFSLLDFISKLPDDQKTAGGFIHVPYQTEQVLDKSGDVPSLTTEQIARALQAAIETAAKHIQNQSV